MIYVVIDILSSIYQGIPLIYGGHRVRMVEFLCVIEKKSVVLISLGCRDCCISLFIQDKISFDKGIVMFLAAKKGELCALCLCLYTNEPISKR